MEKKIVTIQDISCYGQCSITVALPVLSAFGYETAIIPSAVLSTHTSGFKGFTVHNLTDEIPLILDHWKKEGIKFDALYSGYLGENKHIDLVIRMKKEHLNPNGIFFLDPVMGDNGKLYPVFNSEYVQEVKRLVKEADIIVPNLTEACLLSDVPYQEELNEEYIHQVIEGLVKIGAKSIVLTGISYKKDMTGVLLYKDGKYQHYEHERINKSFHGTGDVYSSTLLGIYLETNDLFYSAKMAAEFVVKCINNTINDENHWYGVKFEPILAEFVNEIKKG